jgi:hypothetical protein
MEEERFKDEGGIMKDEKFSLHPSTFILSKMWDGDGAPPGNRYCCYGSLDGCCCDTPRARSVGCCSTTRRAPRAAPVIR